MEASLSNITKLSMLLACNKREILIRVIGIIVVSSLFTFIEFGFDYSGTKFYILLLISLVRTALIWNGSMLIINFTLLRYPIFKQPGKLIVSQVVMLSLFVIIIENGEVFATENYAGLSLNRNAKMAYYVGSLLITFMISSIYASVAFFTQWKTDMLRANALEKANLEARYETLRNQVNPHFLFNSLNTLLMMVGDNPVASKYVESVSEFMRYMLNSRDKEAVLIRDELKIAREYAFIQQSRFGDKLKVIFNIPENCFHYAVPPLALQMLIENAIKHNVVSNEHQLKVKVFISNNNYLVVENEIRPKIDKEPSTGVGLDNIIKRYLFLSDKEVIIKQDHGKFTVMLPLFERSI
ncbi:MAG: histidine kinase [Bacteroidales bacterium]|nr:histidine kinase [Bacteroidales bacterium]